MGRAARFAELCKARWGLFRRQAEVLYLLCWGITAQRDQARAMGIGLEVLRAHRHKAFAATGAICQAHAAAIAWPIFLASREGA